MPKISKAPKEKNTAARKKTAAVKSKEKPVKKKTTVKKTTIKKAPVKKIVRKPAAPKKTAPKTNKVTVDIISDEEEFSIFNEPAQAFSSWPNFDNDAPAEDIFSTLEKTDTDNQINNQNRDTDDIFNDTADDDIDDIPSEDNDEYNKQKNFFSDWALQNAPKNGEEKVTLAPAKKSIGLYRRQAFMYLGATAILLAAVFYLFFSKLTIIISPQGETINDAVTFDVGSAAATTSAIDLGTDKTVEGNLQVTEVTAEKNYQTSGEEIPGEEITGTVTLINKSAKAQPLVVKTRLLSADNKLYRLKESVNIPAGGSVVANVYADNPSADMSISEPTHFTIPGLWAGLQDKIYAESSAPLTLQTKTKMIIKQSDLDQAKKDISEVLDLKIKNDLKSVASDKVAVYDDNGEDSDVTISFNAKVGEEKTNFTAKAVKKTAIATFSKDKVIDLAKARLLMLIPDDKQLSDFNQNQITYSLESFDKKTNTAVVKAYFTGTMSLKSDSSLIDRKKLVGLNSQQISEYLNSFPEIKDYKLDFSPSFIKTAPNLPDRINIEINNLQ